MAREIDEQIVQMRFENQGFNEKANQTIQTIDKLTATTSNLGNNPNALAPLLTAIDNVNQKFSIMQTIATGALLQIGARAAAVGEQFVRNMTIDQVTAGWSKYAEKTRSVKTIMNATGDSIDTVNGYLEKLMWYTDETSYNFVDMTSNIGKFTAQGIALDDATTAMMGISNWAAQAGQGVNEASRAMYNLSQALGLGEVRIQDWMSVENANMATKEFKEMAIQTAKELGTLTEAGMDAKNELVTFKTFRQTLADGWFNSDVLIATLKKYGAYTEEVYKITQEQGISAAEAMALLGDSYSGVGEKAFKAAQVSKTFSDAVEATKDAVSSGWLSTFEALIGNLETQEKWWTHVTAVMWDLFAASGAARVELLHGWEAIGGQKVLLDALGLVLDNIVQLYNLIGAAWRRAFPEMTAERLLELTVGFRNFIESIRLTDSAFNNIADAVGGVLSVFKGLATFAGAIVKGLFPAVETMNGLAGGVLAVAGAIGRGLTAMSEYVFSAENMASVTQLVSDAFGTLRNVVFGLIEAFTGMDVTGDGVVTSFGGVFSGIVDGIGDILSSGANVGDTAADIFGAAFTKIGEIFRTAEEETGSGEFFTALGDALSHFSETTKTHLPILTSFTESIGMLVATIVNGLNTLFTNLTGSLDWNEVFGLASMLVVLLTFKEFNKMNPMGSIGNIVEGLNEVLGGVRLRLIGEAAKALAQAIAILAGSIALLGSLPLANALTATGILVGIGLGLNKFIEVLSEMEQDNVKNLGNLAPSLLIIGAAFAVIAGAVAKMGALDIGDLIVSVLALGGITLALQKFTSSMQGVKIEASTAVSLLAIVAALDLIVPAIAILSMLDLTSMGVALLALAGVMTEVALFSKTMQNVNVDPKSAGALIAVAAAVDLLALAIAGLAGLSLEQVGVALAALAGIMLELSIFSRAMTTVSPMSAVALIAMAAAVDLVALAIAGLANLSLEQVGISLAAVGGVLLEFIAAMALLQFVGPQASIASVGILALAAAILAVTPAIAALSILPTEGIKTALIAIAAALGIFVAAVYLLSPVIVPLLAVAAALSAITLSVAALLAGLGLVGLSLLQAVSAFILFGSMSKETVQQACDNIMLVLDNLIAWILKSYVKFKYASVTMFAAFIDALAEVSPKIANGVLQILNDILQALVKWSPELFQALLDLLTILDDYMEPLGAKAVELIVHFFDGIIRGIGQEVKGAVQKLIDAGKEMWQAFKNALFGGGSGKVEDTGAAMVKDAARGIQNGARSSKREVRNAGRDTASNYLGGFDEEAGRNSPWTTMIERAKDACAGLAQGVKEGAFMTKDAGKSTADDYLSSFGQEMFGENGEGGITKKGNETANAFVDTVEKSGMGSKAAKSAAKQIDEDKELEKAAKKKAEAVAKAFQTEFEKIDLRLGTVGSTYGIAEAYLSPDATELEKNMLKLEQLQKELAILGDKYSISWDKYQNTMANPKATNVDIEKSRNEYLKAYEEIAKKAKEVAELQATMYGSFQEAENAVFAELQDLGNARLQLVQAGEQQMSEATKEAYQSFLHASSEEQKQYYYDLWQQLREQDTEGIFGDIMAKPIDPNEIRKDVYEILGLDPNNPVEAFMSVPELVNQAVAASQETYLQAVEETYPGIIQAYETKLAESADEVVDFVENEVSPKYARAGAEMADNTAEGMEVRAPQVQHQAESISTMSSDAVMKKTEDWVEVGSGMMDGIIKGIENQRSEVINAAIKVCQDALSAAKQELGIASPSKEFLAVGMYTMEGMANGIERWAANPIEAAKTVTDNMLEPFSGINRRVTDVMGSSLSPVITPSLDLRGAERGATYLNRMWRNRTYDIAGTLRMRDEASRTQMDAIETALKREPTVVNNNTFNQTNNSPKALSTADIYRDTRSMFSRFGRGIR